MPAPGKHRIELSPDLCASTNIVFISVVANLKIINLKIVIMSYAAEL